MRLLASFVMRGMSQAVMAIGALALLSLLFPPLSVLSSAAVALVTLRRGLRDGLIVLLLGTTACALLALPGPGGCDYSHRLYHVTVDAGLGSGPVA